MNNKFFVGYTTDVQDGVFLVIGQELDYDFASVLVLPEKDRDAVQWGDVLKINMSGPKLKVDEEWFPCVSLIAKEDRGLNKRQAMELQDKLNDFMEEKGWTEEVEADLDELMQEHAAYFNIFPD